MQITSIQRSTFNSALSLAGAHGHRWPSLVDHPAVAAILAGSPHWLDLTSLEAAFAAAEEDDDDSQFGGLGFALAHTTGSGRLSWDCTDAGVVLTVERPSVAWQVWAAQRQLVDDLSEEPGVGAVLGRMLPPEPERGSFEVARLVVPATGELTMQCEPTFMRERHIAALVKAVDALGASLLPAIEVQLEHAGVDPVSLRRAGVTARQVIHDDGRTVSLSWWGRATLFVTVRGFGETPLSYDCSCFSGDAGALGEAAAQEASIADHLVDRLRSWAGLRPSVARAAVLQAFADAGLPVPAMTPMTADDIEWDSRPSLPGEDPHVEIVFDANE